MEFHGFSLVPCATIILHMLVIIKDSETVVLIRRYPLLQPRLLPLNCCGRAFSPYYRRAPLEYHSRFLNVEMSADPGSFMTKDESDKDKTAQLGLDTELLTEAPKSAVAPGVPSKPYKAVPSEDEAVVRTPEEQKALSCAQMQCITEETRGAVCACNFNTGNVVTFKNECDLRRHNCRFDTAFKIILNEICPWQFESRRDPGMSMDYNSPTYYNQNQ